MLGIIVTVIESLLGLIIKIVFSNKESYVSSKKKNYVKRKKKKEKEKKIIAKKEVLKRFLET